MTDIDSIPSSLRVEVLVILSKMSLLSEVSASRVQSNPGAGKPGHREPSGKGDDVFSVWSLRFAGVTDEARCRRLLAFARAELAQITRRTFPAPRDRQIEIDTQEDIVQLGEGMDPHEVSALISQDGKGHCPPGYVRRVRKRNDLEPETGRPHEPMERRVTYARRLAAQGLSQRRIAHEMQISQSTVHRLLTDQRDRVAA